MSCTSFVDGELVAHDRLYDVLNISVVSEKNTVGYYDMNSKVQIDKVDE
jgi:teichoic acid transport system ATP-binding protein